MAFKNFVYAEDEEDLSFLPKDPLLSFSTGSLYVLVNIKPLAVDEGHVLHSAEVTTNFEGSLKPELFVAYPGRVATQMKNMKCKTRGGSSKPPAKRKLANGSLNSHTTRAKTSILKDDVSFLSISDEDKDKILAFEFVSIKNHLDNHMDVELLDLHDRCYARQAFVDTDVNRRPRKLLEVIGKLRGECDVINERREPERKSLRVSGPIEKARLEAVEVSHQKEVDDVRRDRMYCLEEFATDPSAPVEVLLLKKPPFIQRPAPSKTLALVASSQKTTPSSVPISTLMSLPTDIFVVKP
nr:hypothetical protein [Tanacetum cinerariifolium]